MKNMRFLLILILIVFVFGGCSQNQETGIDYGQDPPGLIPEVFAPGVISIAEDTEFGCTFSPDGDEIYYTVRKNKTDMPVIMTSRMTEGKWSIPEQLFAQGDDYFMEPHMTADGQTLYFGSSRQMKGVTQDEAGIWQMKRTDSGWSDMSYVMTGMYVSTTNDGSIYLSDIYKTWQLVKIPFVNGEYGERIILKGGPNRPVRGIHPCISRDENFIIFDSDRPDGYGGEGDLYVSFNLGDNQWSDGFNLGSTINTPGVEFAASLSPDGKYLFYMKDDDLYWVDIAIIEPFRP